MPRQTTLGVLYEPHEFKIMIRLCERRIQELGSEARALGRPESQEATVLRAIKDRMMALIQVRRGTPVSDALRLGEATDAEFTEVKGE